jgi:hypothetical protein
MVRVLSLDEGRRDVVLLAQMTPAYCDTIFLTSAEAFLPLACISSKLISTHWWLQAGNAIHIGGTNYCIKWRPCPASGLTGSEVLEGVLALEVAVAEHVEPHRLVVGREADDLLIVEVDVASGADRVDAVE